MAASGLQRRKVEVMLDKVEQLPTLPGVAMHLLPLVMADRPVRREIQMAVEVDAALSAKVLQVAVDLGHPPDTLTSIDRVFTLVPLEALAANLLSLETPSPEVLAEVRLARLWRHILATGMASQVIATRLGTIPPQAALLAGILHDIGQMALAILMPKAYAQVLDRVEASGKDLLEAERELLGVDHAVLGKRLAQRWNFSAAIQNVIWLHHQAQVPTADRPNVGALTQVVRLADLLVRREGFSYHPSEEVRDSAAEVAERLGLSGAHAEQIGRQVASAFELNARPAGLETEPSPEALRRMLGSANARLGRLYRASYAQSHHLDVRVRRSEMLIRLNAGLADCRSAREVLETVATTARDVLGLRTVVPYVLARDGDYVEGIRCTAEGGIEDHFLCDVSAAGDLEPPPTEDRVPFAAPGAPVRAERTEGWLFERQGERLGPGPFYTAAMTVEGVKVGGIVFSLGDPPRDLTPQEAGELVALASLAGIALKRAQAEADLVGLSEELAEVNRELQAAHVLRLQQRNVSSVSEMAAGAAHEINNPLAIISGRAQQLAADEKDPARQDLLKTIVHQAGRVSDIITELRLFAVPPAPQFQTVDPGALTQRLTDELQSRSAPATVRIETRAAPDCPRIRVDPDQVSGALKELIQNGVEACARAGGGTVTVTVQPLPTEAAVRFVVADDGPGMDPQVRARAFDPFYSGYDAGRRRGLGLPRAYRAVEANGGQMSLESAPGRGTTVRVTFRAAEASASDGESVQAQGGTVRR